MLESMNIKRKREFHALSPSFFKTRLASSLVKKLVSRPSSMVTSSVCFLASGNDIVCNSWIKRRREQKTLELEEGKSFQD